MEIPSSILGSIVGAFISGVIGAITVEYRNHRDEIAEIEDWYDQTIRLADQVEQETPDPILAWVRREGLLSTVEREVFPEQENDMAAAYGKIGEQLRNQVYRAPTAVREEVIGTANETARYCRIVDRETLVLASGNVKNFLPTIELAVESANALRESAEEAKQDVGLI